MEYNTKNSANRNGQTITYYSYKGGVGRSMALVNIACLAAKEQKKVLLIDCDLEAPGLHQFFQTNEETRGFVDLISDINDWIDIEENNNEEGYCRFMAGQVEKYISKNVNPIAANTTGFNDNGPNTISNNNSGFDTAVSVDLIKAGKFDSDYSKKLGAINWLDIYKKAPAFFRTFAYCLEKDYDYIFVDARTGLADTSGICTMLMPQKLVLVFALNNQNINGVVDVAGQAIDYRFDSNDYRRLDIYPLPSRIENSANPYLQKWIDNYKGKFEILFKEKYKLDACSLSPYFDRSFIQYYAIHAYGENIPALYESAASSNFITYNYNNFLTVLKKNIPSWEVISTEEELSKERQANDHFRKGLDIFYKKDYTNSIVEYTNAINLKQDYTDAYFNRGLSYEAIIKLEEAIIDYTKVIELENNAADAYSAIGGVKLTLGKKEEALGFFDKAIELKPNFAEAYNNRGLVKNGLDKNEEALADYTKAIELKPDYADAYNNRGVTEYDLKQYEQAIVDYTKAIELKPDYADAYNNRGVIKYDLKKYEESILDYSKAIELKQDYAVAYYNRGITNDKLKKNEEALVDYSKAIELKPDYADAYNNRGIVNNSLKKYEEALVDYSKAIELRPDHADAYNNRGLVKDQLDKNEEALVDYSKAIELKPEFANFYNNRGIVNDKLKKYEEALTDYSKAIELKPDYAIAYNNRGIVNDKLKKYMEAIINYSKAIELKHDYGEAYNNRAFVYREMKDYNMALSDNENSLLIENNSPDNWSTKAEILSDMGDDEGFYENIEKAMGLGLYIKKEIDDLPTIMNKYIKQSRFQDLLKKYTVDLNKKGLPIS